MKFFRIPILIAGLTILPSAFAEEMSCHVERKFKGGRTAGHSTKLTVDSEKISALYVESFNASGKEGEAYFCTFDTSRLDSKAKWSTRGNRTFISVRDDDQKSVVTVRRIGDAFIIDPSGISRYYCGFGAEWPERITVEAGKKKRKVTPSL